MIEAFTSLIDNYKSKIRNPLIGTIISVWIIHNWRIVYALFNFDEDFSMRDKINYIEEYFNKKTYFGELWTIIWIAFLIIFITFFLLAASRFITNGYYKVVEPWIKKQVDKNEIFTIENKKKLDVEIEELKGVIGKLRDVNTKTENINRSLVAHNEEIQSKYDKELVNFSEETRKSIERHELLEKKYIPANKVIVCFDEIISGLSSDLKEDLQLYAKNDKHVNNRPYKNFVGLKAELEKIGVIIYRDKEQKSSLLAILFLEYFKMIQEEALLFKKR